ncbi:hypothetical protein [Burkholderia glumae]|uniref:hypothetical protein n=1 Tax=Burkholderia glumae TaxID=337 RepID=UPI0021508143|nr:hypothetical protein [Burkholderia glumae]
MLPEIRPDCRRGTLKTGINCRISSAIKYLFPIRIAAAMQPQSGASAPSAAIRQIFGKSSAMPARLPGSPSGSMHFPFRFRNHRIRNESAFIESMVNRSFPIYLPIYFVSNRENGEFAQAERTGKARRRMRPGRRRCLPLGLIRANWIGPAAIAAAVIKPASRTGICAAPHRQPKNARQMPEMPPET